MASVRAKIVVEGFKDRVKGLALVDSGASITILDENIADKVEVIHTGRRRSLTTASGHKIEGEIAILKKLIIDDEVLDYERTLIVEIPREVKETLRRNELAEWIMVGLLTIEAANYIPDTSTGTLKKVEGFIL